VIIYTFPHVDLSLPVFFKWIWTITFFSSKW
jgi:hypothetical protein